MNEDLYQIMASAIKKCRLEKGYTQEKLAEMLGVSVPAVSKWETGHSVPDIAMLSPLARALGTTPDELLRFRQELPEEEVIHLMTQVKACCEKEGFEQGMALAGELVREYPSSELLKLRAANAVLIYAYTIPEDYTDEEYEKIQENSIRWFEELSRDAKDQEIKKAAAIALISQYISGNKLEEAEALIDSIPAQEYDAARMKTTLYFLKGEEEKAMEAAQQFLFRDIQYVRNGLLSMYSVAMKRKDYGRALSYALEFERIGREYSPAMGSGAECVVKAYLAAGDTANALSWFSRYVDAIIQMSENFEESIYFDAIACKLNIARTTQGKATAENLKEGLYKSILMNPMYSRLEEFDVFREDMARLKEHMGRY